MGFLVGLQLYIIDGPNGRPERVHYWRWRSVKSRYSVTHKAGGKALISGGHKFDHITLHLSLKLRVLKVRQIRNDFFKLTFLSKNERTNSTLLLVDLFSFVFWKKVKTPKRHFAINWPLHGTNLGRVIFTDMMTDEWRYWIVLLVFIFSFRTF